MITANTLEHMDRISADAEARGAAAERERLLAELKRLERIDAMPASELAEEELDLVLGSGATIAYLLGFLGQGAEPERCAWTDDGDGAWETACGEAEVFTDGGPTENRYAFCPYCGRPLAVEDEHGGQTAAEPEPPPFDMMQALKEAMAEGARCRWCGKYKAEHADHLPADEPVPRAGCGGLTSNFLAAESRP